MSGRLALRNGLLGKGRHFILLTILAYVWHLVLLALGSRLAPGGMVFLALLPLLLAPLWAMWASVGLVRRTSKRHSSFRGGAFSAWRLLVGNLGAVLVQVLVYSVLVTVGALLLFRSALGVAGLVDLLPIPSVDWILGFLVRAYAAGLLFTLVAAAISQFAYLFSRLGERYRWLMGIWVSILATWIGMRLVPLFAQWFRGLPDFVFDEIYAVGDVFEFRTVLVDSGPFAGVVLFLVAVTVASAYMLASAPVQGDSPLATSPGGASSQGGI